MALIRKIKLLTLSPSTLRVAFPFPFAFFVFSAFSALVFSEYTVSRVAFNFLIFVELTGKKCKN